MKLKSFLDEAYRTNTLINFLPEWLSNTKLKTGDRKKANRDIQKILKPTYFKSIPLGQIDKALRKHGMLLIQEDNTPWSGLLLGGVDKTEMVNFNLGWLSEENEPKRYKAVPNAVFTMTYYKMPSGKYEVIGYVS